MSDLRDPDDNEGAQVTNCIECGNPHTDPELQEFEDRWCWDCMEAESLRSAGEDAVGLVRDTPGILGQWARQSNSNATTRSRPPKFFLRPDEYEKYGYK